MLEIRPAALSEFALLPAIEADADLAFESLDPPMSSADFPPPSTAEEYAQAFHIMVAGRPPAGFVRLEVVSGEAYLEQLSVARDQAGRGIGRALVTAAIAWAREAGFHTMTLSTFAQVPFNAPFYASCGFTEVPEQEWDAEMMKIWREQIRIGLDQLGRRIFMRVHLTTAE